jgi:hypothetical protein
MALLTQTSRTTSSAQREPRRGLRSAPGSFAGGPTVKARGHRRVADASPGSPPSNGYRRRGAPATDEPRTSSLPLLPGRLAHKDSCVAGLPCGPELLRLISSSRAVKCLLSGLSSAVPWSNQVSAQSSGSCRATPPTSRCVRDRPEWRRAWPVSRSGRGCPRLPRGHSRGGHLP